MKYVVALVLAIVSTSVLAGGMKPWKKGVPNQACWCSNSQGRDCSKVRPTQCFIVTEQKFIQWSSDVGKRDCVYDKTTICVDPMQ